MDEDNCLPTAEHTSLECASHSLSRTDIVTSETPALLPEDVNKSPDTAQRRPPHQAWDRFDKSVEVCLFASALVIAFVAHFRYRTTHDPNIWFIAYVWTCIMLVLPSTFKCFFTPPEALRNDRIDPANAPHCRGAQSLGRIVAIIISTLFSALYADFCANQGSRLSGTGVEFWVGPAGRIWNNISLVECLQQCYYATNGTEASGAR